MFALSLSGCERAPPPRLLGYEELGELRVATRSDALSYRIGTDGRESGFEHDLLLELGRYLGVPVKFSVLPSSLDSIYAVTHNNMHLAAAGLVRNERRQVIWSAPIREVEYVLVGRNLSRQLSSEKELANRRIGVRRGSVPAEALDAIRNRIPSMRLTYPISGGEAELLERVARGEIDLVATDRVNYNMASNFHPELSIAMPLKIKSEIAWALPHNASKRFVTKSMPSSHESAAMVCSRVWQTCISAMSNVSTTMTLQHCSSASRPACPATRATSWKPNSLPASIGG